MSPEELERYLHRNIPLSAAMQVTVTTASRDEVVLEAPLAPNVNHRGTLFGGSAAAAATLSAWSLLFLRLRSAERDARIVIQRSDMHYELPVTGGFRARSTSGDTDQWRSFLALLERRGKARLALTAALEQDGRRVAGMRGDFVAFGSGR